MELARIAPKAMLLVRSGAGGISHSPLETMTAEDAEIATAVRLDFIDALAEDAAGAQAAGRRS